jgi:hypothetical protein
VAAPRTHRRAVLAAGLVGLASAAGAGDFEVTGQLGRSLPFYEQTFALDPAGLLPSGFPVQSAGAFQLVAQGGLSAGGSVTWYPVRVLGIEARFDSAAIDAPVTGGSLGTGTGPVLGLSPTLSAQVDGSLDISRLNTFSLDVKLRSPGRSVQVFASAGLSHLPATSFSAGVTVQFSLRLLAGLPVIALPPIGLGAQASLESSLGGNLGLGVRFGLGEKLGFVIEGRVFAFPEQALRWGPTSGAPSLLESELAGRLDPIRFRPGFFQVTAGLSLGS